MSGAESLISCSPFTKKCQVRPAVVYGTGDINGLTPRLIIGSIYKEIDEKMESLYSSGLRVNTVRPPSSPQLTSPLFICHNKGSSPRL